MGFLAGGELVVVETEDDRFLETVDVQPDVLVIRSGYVGRPTVVAHEDVLSVTLFADSIDEGSE